jgi:hypothetical protein
VLDTVTSIRADAGEGSRGVAGACAASVSSGGHSAVTMQRGLFQSSISASHASGSIMCPRYHESNGLGKLQTAGAAVLASR